MNDADLGRLDHWLTLPNKWNIAVGPIVVALVDPEVGTDEILLKFDEHMTDLRLILLDMTNTVNQIENVEFRHLTQPLILNYGAKFEALSALQKGYEIEDTAAIEKSSRDLYDAAQAAKGLICSYFDGLKKYASGDELKQLDDQSVQICK